MRAPTGGRFLLLTLCAVVFFIGMWGQRPVEAGGPLAVGGTFGVSGQPFTWDMAAQPGGKIQYRTDGGNLGLLDNATANTLVQSMFQVWEDVPTSTVAFNRAGALNSVPPNFVDGDVSTMVEYDAVAGAVASSCNGTATGQSPIIYDVDGTLFLALGFPSGVIGFAGPCTLSSTGRITAARAALNGRFRDGIGPIPGNPELSANEFEAVFIHEFGHFFGMDHSQINLNCLTDRPSCPNFSNDTFGLPTMFPFLISGLQESLGIHPARTLSQDDIAWVSRLYPTAGFNSSFGTITGTIFFSDGVTPTQGVNVIARNVSNPRANAVSVVSGYLFTDNPGQSVTGDNIGGSQFGSRDVTLIGSYEIPGLAPGSYTVEVESINPAFTGGSGVGPLSPPFPNPGPPEFFNFGESATDAPSDVSNLTVTAGATVPNINIILNGTPPGLDPLEPNDSVGAAAPIFNGTSTGLSISPFGNEDFYSFGANGGTMVTVETVAQRAPVNSPLDSVIEIVNSGGTRLTTCRDLGSAGPFTNPCLSDDLTLGVLLDSGLEFQPLTTGTFFVHVLDWRGDGRPDLQYQLSLTGASSINPVPTLSSLSPFSTIAGTPGLTLLVTGAGFVPSSVVRWNGSNRGTTFVSSTQLRAAITTFDLSVAGTASVAVFNTAPGGGTSNVVTFTINNPVPSITQLLPDNAAATGPGLTLTVNGSNFVPASVVRWNGTPRTTTFINGSQLQASILVGDIAATGFATVSVFNPTPGGGTSSSFLFVINIRNPLPTLTALSPPGAVAGGPTFTLTLTGSNFVGSSTVRWNGVDRTTTFLGSTQLQASIPAGDIPSPGTSAVTVFSPSPGGGTSNSLTFPVTAAPNPAPTMGTLSLDNTTVGAVRGSLPLTVNGSNFVSNSVVRWNGINRLTNFVNPSQLQALIPADDLAVAGTALVTVFSPAPGGGTSSAATFTINNPAPVLSSLSPSSAAAGGSAFTLTLGGSNFVPTSVVRWNGANRTTTFVSGTQLQAAIPGSDIVSVGTPSVTVMNPGPSGGTSGAMTFTITAPGNPAPTLGSLSPSSATAGREGLSLTVNGSSFVPGSVVRWNGNTRPTTFISSTELRAAIPASDLALAGAASVTVFNPAPVGGTSSPATFTLNNPVPTLANLSPAGALAGGAGFTLTLSGSEFVPGSVVRWNGVDKVTTFVSRTQVQAAIPASDLALAGTASVTVFNPAPGGGSATPVSFFVLATHAAPTITTLTPNSAPAGRGQFTLVVTGTGFDFASVVTWNGSNRTTTFVSPTEVRADILASDVAAPGSAPVRVVNPAPGGGTSIAATFTITP